LAAGRRPTKQLAHGFSLENREPLKLSDFARELGWIVWLIVIAVSLFARPQWEQCS
jgi:hypothetical protein